MADYRFMETPLDRSVDAAIARVNAAAIEELKNPKPVDCDICHDGKWKIVFPEGPLREGERREATSVRCVCNPDPGPEATRRFMDELVQAIHEHDWEGTN